MTRPIFANVSSHLFTLGTTGRGRSLLEGELAKKLGISVDQITRIEPTPEQLMAVEKDKQARQAKAEARLQAVRTAYWDNTDHNGSEFYVIADSLNEFCGIGDATVEQQRAVFMMLPEDIIGGGIQWGFDDTEVRDQIYVFVRDHAADVKKALPQT